MTVISNEASSFSQWYRSRSRFVTEGDTDKMSSAYNKRQQRLCLPKTYAIRYIRISQKSVTTFGVYSVQKNKPTNKPSRSQNLIFFEGNNYCIKYSVGLSILYSRIGLTGGCDIGYVLYMCRMRVTLLSSAARSGGGGTAAR